LVLKKGGVQTSDVKTIFSLEDQEMDKIVYVLLRSGLIQLEQRVYLVPTPIAKIFLHENDEKLNK
jgi:hypothetical protein